MIRAHGLAKRYRDRAVLTGLDFEIARGERVALLGRNGAGKTTLFRCLLGLTAFEGGLSIDGIPPGRDSSAARARIAYVPQQPPVFDLSLGDFLDLFADLRGTSAVDVRACLGELRLPLERAESRPMSELSGGMLQKAYLALALASRAPVLLLDEPTASLDPESRRTLIARLADLDPATTMIFAAHRFEEVVPLTSRIFVLRAGRIAFDGMLPELLMGGRGMNLVEIPRAACAGSGGGVPR